MSCNTNLFKSSGEYEQSEGAESAYTLACALYDCVSSFVSIIHAIYADILFGPTNKCMKPTTISVFL
jgi:single-stranded DNA-specific DHH superfamily exonuclease